MLNNNIFIISVFFFSFIFTFLLIYVISKFLMKMNLLDHPDKIKKKQEKPIPYSGGLSIMITLLVTLFIILILNKEESNTLILSIVILSILVGISGFFDDIFNLNPLIRILIQTFAIIISIQLTFSFTFLISNLYLFIFLILISLFVINSTNLIDNHDGVLGLITLNNLLSFSFISSIFFLKEFQYLIVSLFAALLAFLIFNYPPAKVYLGNSGSSFIGFLISQLLILQIFNGDIEVYNLLIPFFIFAPQILDTTVVITSRLKLRKKIMVGGRDHISHRLAKLGFNKRKVSIYIWLISILFNMLSISFFVLPIYYVLMIAVLGFLLMIYLIKLFLSLSF